MTVEPIDLTLPWPGGLEAVRQCPVCSDPRRREERVGVRDGAFGAAPGLWNLQRCLGCEALYLDPRPDRASLHLAYRDYHTHAVTPPVDAFVARLRRALSNGYRNRIFATETRPSLRVGAFLMPLFSARAAHIRKEDRGLGRAGAPGMRVLDVGCGNGSFLAWARELGWECYGVEIDPVAADVARNLGVAILGSEVRELGTEYAGSFDAITLSHVIEHLYDPMEVLRQCWSLLKPGGSIWLETPNTDSLGYEVYGSHWRGLEAPRHLVLFNTASLRWSLEHAGFERVRVLPPADLIEPMFAVSAAMRLGRIAETDARPLSGEVRKEASRATRRARSILRRDAGKSEFITMIARRPLVAG
jgi:2-polyprenyl-3-methyl-5-hydroxy-6-metoxy-1,4-benzoquinol methylase